MQTAIQNNSDMKGKENQVNDLFLSSVKIKQKFLSKTVSLFNH